MGHAPPARQSIARLITMALVQLNKAVTVTIATMKIGLPTLMEARS